jgi:uncharacterized protein (TIGR01777 family)
MKIAITGATGLVGQRLLSKLGNHSLTILSRRAGTQPPGVPVVVWDPMTGPPEPKGLSGTDVVIHLAGEPVAQRWTAEAKERIRASRVTGTRNLVQGLARLDPRPKALVCASAIGYYGSRGDEVLNEASAPGSGFLPEVCTAWEREAEAAESLGIRVVRVRIGIVLVPEGGALKRMLPPFRAGLGGPLGSGQQWMSWVHVDDLANLFRHAAENPVRGAVNGTAPHPVTNSEFTSQLAKQLHRPAIFRVPGLALRVMFGEMAQILLSGQRVVPVAAESSGFRFAFQDLDAALANLLR